MNLKHVSLALVLLAAIACSSTAPTPRSSPSADVHWDISNIDHWRVDYWVDRFSNGDKRAEYEASLQRMAQYAPMIRAKLRERGMPEDLVYLAMIESGFNPDAHSPAGAAGIWQLMPDTARRYGLIVDDTTDDRHDPAGSTDAALSYLSNLYDRFGSWYLAIAAYNSGENRIGRILTGQTGSERGTDADYYKYWDLLPGETRDFVPVMIAAARIAKEPGRYGFGRS